MNFPEIRLAHDWKLKFREKLDEFFSKRFESPPAMIKFQIIFG